VKGEDEGRTFSRDDRRERLEEEVDMYTYRVCCCILESFTY